jgi:hypothetical protein
MSQLQVTFDGRSYTFQPGQTVLIGRLSDNNIVVSRAGDLHRDRDHYLGDDMAVPRDGQYQRSAGELGTQR